jgi:hypothetical protein
MKQRWLSNTVTVFGSLFFFTAHISAQEFSLEELLPRLKEQAVVLDITARVIEQDQEEVWNSADSRVTIPGRPVGLKLVGANIVVAAQFTPYLRRNGRNVLVAQGQIWVNIPDEGIRYQTTLQTIPLEFGEQIYFFPLGSVSSRDEAWIEIQLELHPYTEKVVPPPPVPGGPLPPEAPPLGENEPSP